MDTKEHDKNCGCAFCAVIRLTVERDSLRAKVEELSEKYCEFETATCCPDYTIKVCTSCWDRAQFKIDKLESSLREAKGRLADNRADAHAVLKPFGRAWDTIKNGIFGERMKDEADEAFKALSRIVSQPGEKSTTLAEAEREVVVWAEKAWAFLDSATHYDGHVAIAENLRRALNNLRALESSGGEK